MTPRPRKVSDEEVFAAAMRAMSRLGPGELTLAEIAGEAGVTAGALVQRFGSKRDLMLALAGQAAVGVDDYMRDLLAKHDSAVDALREYAECFAHLAESPGALARNLAYLQIDLSDPDFRVHLLAQSRATRAGLAMLLQAAVDRGELAPDTDVERLARTVETMLGGSLITWGTYRDGTAAEWLRADVDAVLAPHLSATKDA
jgi:AcrR family transcriptional regulator